MKEYLYLWIDHYLTLDDYAFHSDGFLIENQGISLSSKFNITHTYNKKKSIITFEINPNGNIPENFFSIRIADIKAFVGRNGSGKTLCLKHLLYRIISKEFDADKSIGYILIYKQNGEIHYHKSEAIDYSIEIIFKNTPASLGQFTSEYEKDNVFFYTAAFDNSERLDVFQGHRNISTNALLSSDQETLNNISLKYPQKTNQHYSHITMEMIRKTK